MNTLKRTLALAAALTLSATAFVGCGSSDSSSSKADTATTGANGEATTAAGGEATTGEAASSNTSEAKPNSTDLGEVKLNKGGDKLTIVSWDANDAPKMIELYEKNGGQKAEFHNMACKNAEAAEKLENLFKAGSDVDIYFAEADWALQFINDENRAAALEDLGFSEANFTDTFAYTNEIGRATKGKNEGKMVGVSWQSCPGGFAYNTELAKQYLGVEDEKAMQEKVGDWEKFVAAATEIAEKSDHKVALADSLGGMWQVFAANRENPWVEDGVLLVDDSCKTFADYAKTLWDNGGVTRNSQWGDGWTAAGQQDLCVGYFASTWGLGGFVAEASSKSQGKWKLIQGPDPYFWGGTWMVVNPNTDNAEEAQKFIYTLSVNPESMKDYAKTKPEYVNSVSVMNEVVSNKEVNAEVSANFGGQNYFEPLHANAQKINLKGLITPFDANVKAAFLDAVTEKYCKEGADWDTTVAKFKEDVNKKYPSGLE
jgi:hypothetical protein